LTGSAAGHVRSLSISVVGAVPYLLNTVAGCMPSDLATGSSAEIEEERRLLYVAMTRAKDHLHLMVPQRFYMHGQRSTGDRHVYAQRTRFIPNAITKHFASRSWLTSKATRAPTARTAAGPVDIKAKVRTMWASGRQQPRCAKNLRRLLHGIDQGGVVAVSF
jgi:hypothetical protein